MKLNEIQIRRATLLLSITLYVSSLTQKCYCTTSTCGDSIAVVIVGIFGLFAGGAALSWLANPLLYGAWISLRKNEKLSLALSVLALLFAMSFLFFDTVLDDEAGNYKEIVSYQAGYWLWASSALIMAVGNLTLKRNRT